MTIPRHIVNLARDSFMVGMLMLSTGAFVPLFVDLNDTATAGEGSPVMKILWALIYAVALLRIWPQRHRVAMLLKTSKPIVFLAGLALLSTCWSVDRITTLHLAGTLILTAAVAMDLSIHYSVERQLRLLAIALVIVIVLSVVAEVFFPGLIPGRDVEGPAWHGVFAFKNVFGRAICFTVVVCLAVARKSLPLRLFIIAAGAGLAVLSRSTSAVGYIGLMSLIFFLLPILKWRTIPRRIALTVIALATIGTGYLIVVHFDTITAKLDKDPHLTGRVDLWEYSIDYIQQKPLLGYGYEAFWTYTSQPARRVREAVKWDEAPHAHNGYIDLSLSLGMVGLGAYLLAFGEITRKAYLYFMRGNEAYRRWPLVFLAFALFYQTTESSIISGNSFLWIAFSGLAFSLSAQTAEYRVPQFSLEPVPAT